MPELADIELDGFNMPGDADEFQALLADSNLMTRIAAQYGHEMWAKVNEGYAQASARKDQGAIEAQVAEQVEARLASAIREDRNLGVAGGLTGVGPEGAQALLKTGGARGPHYSTKAPGHAVQATYGSTADAIRAAIAHGEPQKAAGWSDFGALNTKLAQAMEIQAAYSSHIGPSGGFLMPEDFRNQLLSIAHESAVVRSRATVIPMGSPKVTIPKINETNRSSTLFGGVQIYWTEEEATSTASEAAFGTVALEPDTMTGYAEIPNETMMDTLAFDAYFNATFPKAMAFEEDYAFLQGDGVGRPLGVLNSDAIISADAEVGQDADTLVYENILSMWARMLPGSMSTSVWLANQDTIPELGTMALSVGTGGAPIFVANASTGLPMSLFGRPIIFTEKVNELGTAGDLVLLDLSYYLIGDLQTVTVTSSEHYKFKDRKTAFSIVQRVDGQPWLDTEITPRHGTNTLSPFVQLATR